MAGAMHLPVLPHPRRLRPNTLRDIAFTNPTSSDIQITVHPIFHIEHVSCVCGSGLGRYARSARFLAIHRFACQCPASLTFAHLNSLAKSKRTRPNVTYISQSSTNTIFFGFFPLVFLQTFCGFMFPNSYCYPWISSNIIKYTLSFWSTLRFYSYHFPLKIFFFHSYRIEHQSFEVESFMIQLTVAHSGDTTTVKQAGLYMRFLAAQIRHTVSLWFRILWSDLTQICLVSFMQIWFALCMH